MAYRYRELAKSSTSDDKYLNYEEEDALEWKQLNHNTPKREETIEENFDPNNIPDMVWMIPSQFTHYEILGEKKINLRRIAEHTNTHIVHNKGENRIEMWGATDDLNEACQQWNTLAENILARKRKKRKGWEKPEKAPINKKQKEKLKRRKNREDIAKIYLKEPKSKSLYPFNGYFIFPDTDIPITIFLGKDNQLLNPLRIETNCHIWYEPKLPVSHIMQIAGDSHESIEEAAERLKHVFIKVFASKSIPEKGWNLHMVNPPHEPHKIRIANPPIWFHAPYDREPDSEFRLLEPVYEGERIPVVGADNAQKELTQSFNFDALQKISESNTKRFKDALVKALETIHLLDEEIKLRIRFGHVCLTQFPQSKDKDGSIKQILWPIDKFNEKVLKHSLLKSKFATCLTTDKGQLNRLFEFLSHSDPKNDRSQELDGSPFREFKIRALKANGSKQKYPCSFDIQLEKIEKEKVDKEKAENEGNDKKDEKYRIGLWNAVVHERNVLSVNMSCLKNDYSWNLNIQTAKFLSNDRFHPQGEFVHRLRFCSQDRLVYSNTKEIIVTSVCEKTKWKFWWGKDYVVEVTRYEFWDLSNYQKTKPGIDIPLSREPSPIVSYGVTLYKKSWNEYFALNRDLKVGEAPGWHPHDIVDEKETGGADALSKDIQQFLEKLQSNLPMPTAEELYGI